MPAECGLPHDHDKHIEIQDGAVFKCDGDSDKRTNYDKPVYKPGS